MQQRSKQTTTYDTSADVTATPSIVQTVDQGSGDIPVRMDPRILDRMYDVISVLHADYTQVLGKQTADLKQSFQSFVDGSVTSGSSPTEEIYATAHEIRGIAGTFGRPLASQIAARLCDYLDARKIEGATNSDIIQNHIDTLEQVASFTPEPEGIFASIVLKRLEEATTTPPT